MGSIAILGCRLQPLAWVGHVSWGPVAKGTDSGPPRHKRSPNRVAQGEGGIVHLCKIPTEKTLLSTCEPSFRVLISWGGSE